MRVAFEPELLKRRAWRALPLYVRGAYMQMLILCAGEPEPPLISLPDDQIAERIAYGDTDFGDTIEDLVDAGVVRREPRGLVMVNFARYRLDAPKRRVAPLGPVLVTPQVTMALEELRKVPGYPFDYEKDSLFMFRLIEDFPTMNVIEEIGKWGAYKFDRPLTERSSPRAQMRNWFEIALRRHVRDTADRIRKSTEHMQRPDEWADKVERAKREFNLG